MRSRPGAGRTFSKAQVKDNQRVSEQPQQVSPPAAMREYLLELMAQRNTPAMQVAIVREGSIALLEAFGLANIEHIVPATDHSIFSVISMAKAFTGVALMQLVEAGQLDLSAPISSCLDDLPEKWRPVTVCQLATFTSGLPEIMTMAPDFSTGLIGGGSEQDAWDAAYALPLEFAPGEGYRYVQTNYALLGRIIERLSGKPFTEFIFEQQFAPAGMSHTLFAGDRDIIPNRADSYMSVSADGSVTGTISNSHMNCPPILRTAAGLHSTAEDLARWVIGLQQGALLKNSSSFETLQKPVPFPNGRLGVWGVGWVIGNSGTGRISAAVGGAKAQIALYPGGVAVILLANLIGAFPEHFAPISAEEVDLSFLDPIVSHYSS